jgi:hypothetical protein
LVFSISQHSRDFKLLNSFTKYLGCGYAVRDAKLPNCTFQVTKLQDLINIIIPFFKKYSILGAKKEDFIDWCKIIKLVEKKDHLTLLGLDKIKNIKNLMNNRRKY